MTDSVYKNFLGGKQSFFSKGKTNQQTRDSFNNEKTFGLATDKRENMSEIIEHQDLRNSIIQRQAKLEQKLQEQAQYQEATNTIQNTRTTFLRNKMI